MKKLLCCLPMLFAVSSCASEDGVLSVRSGISDELSRHYGKGVVVSGYARLVEGYVLFYAEEGMPTLDHELTAHDIWLERRSDQEDLSGCFGRDIRLSGKVGKLRNADIIGINSINYILFLGDDEDVCQKISK